VHGVAAADAAAQAGAGQSEETPHTPGASSEQVELEKLETPPPMLGQAFKGSGHQSTGHAPFVRGLRDALGLHNVSRANCFDGAVESKLRTLFQRCDTDRSGTLGRAEFSRALSILNLERHIRNYGEEHGLIHGIHQLFTDLDEEDQGGISEAAFVSLFKRLYDDEEKKWAVARHSKSSKANYRAGSSLEQFEREQRRVFQDEMTGALDRLKSPDEAIKEVAWRHQLKLRDTPEKSVNYGPLCESGLNEVTSASDSQNEMNEHTSP